MYTCGCVVSGAGLFAILSIISSIVILGTVLTGFTVAVCFSAKGSILPLRYISTSSALLGSNQFLLNSTTIVFLLLPVIISHRFMYAKLNCLLPNLILQPLVFQSPAINAICN